MTHHHQIRSLGTVALLGVLLLGVALAGCTGNEERGPLQVPESADIEGGKKIIQLYGCGTCHRIPGIAGANGRVGPSLEGFGQQFYIAGAVPNNLDNLVQWLMDPQSIEPGTIMPDFDLEEAGATNIAAYLATLD